MSVDAFAAPARAALPPLGALIDGRWIDGEQTFAVRNKFSGALIADVTESSPETVTAAVAAVERGFQKGAPPPFERARILYRATELLDAARTRFTRVMLAEVGFTPADIAAEFDRALVTLRLCAEEATRIVGEMVPFAGSPGQHRRMGFTLRVPLGVVCAITPFNSPLNTVLHKVGPALAAGNAVVLKPSNHTPLTAALVCELLLDAGLPPELLALTPGSGSKVGAQLVADPRIAFYTFTGSTDVGASIQAGAGLRRTQMELGSIASTIVCADADLERAAPKIASAAFRKAGQVCTSVQRLYVQRGALEEMTDRLAAAAHDTRYGDPSEADVAVGPMISEAAARRAEAWIEEAKDAGAEVLIGGRRTDSVLQPTVLRGARSGMRVIDEEIFAPCVSILPFDGLDDAVALANDSPYGLAAGVFTRDIDKALQAAQSLRFGAIHINETSSSRADGMPFGGVKASGFGREGPRYAIRELTEERLVTFNP